MTRYILTRGMAAEEALQTRTLNSNEVLITGAAFGENALIAVFLRFSDQRHESNGEIWLGRMVDLGGMFAVLYRNFSSDMGLRIVQSILRISKQLLGSLDSHPRAFLNSSKG